MRTKGKFMSAIAVQTITDNASCGGPGNEEGELVRAHRRALLAWHGEPFEGISDAILIDLVVTSNDPAIRDAAMAALVSGRSRG